MIMNYCPDGLSQEIYITGRALLSHYIFLAYTGSILVAEERDFIFIADFFPWERDLITFRRDELNC